MNTAVTTPQSFEDRMKDRIKESIGELITDAELSELVKRGIDQAFFTERTENNGWNTTKVPSLMSSIAKDLMKERVCAEVEKVIKEREAEVMQIIATRIQEGMGAALIGAVTIIFQGSMYNFQSNLEQTIRNLQTR